MIFLVKINHYRIIETERQLQHVIYLVDDVYPPPTWDAAIDDDRGYIYYVHQQSGWCQYPKEGGMKPDKNCTGKPWHCNRCFWPLSEPLIIEKDCCRWCACGITMFTTRKITHIHSHSTEIRRLAQITHDLDVHDYYSFGPARRVSVIDYSEWVRESKT